jgi:hypothetical protein
MDPAAIGTALIGLDAVRARSDETPRRTSHRRVRRSRRPALRSALAAGLRTLADSLEAPKPLDGTA